MRSQDLHERQHQCLLFVLVLSHFQPTEEQNTNTVLLTTN
jgi:hypothetical protein